MKVCKNSKQSGFSLVELMVVVGIIGILAALAVPRLQVFMAKAKQSEAKSILHNIYSLQASYFAEENTYGTTTQIGYLNGTSAKRLYDGSVTANSATDFTGQAALRAGMSVCNGDTSDTWTINAAQTVTAPAAPACN